MVAELTSFDLDPLIMASRVQEEIPRSRLVNEFVRYYIDFRSGATSNPGRFTLKEAPVTPDPSDSNNCVRFESLVEDRGEPQAEGEMWLTTWGRICLHPQNTRRALVAEYSERRLKTYDAEEALKQEGETWLASLAFDSIP